MGRREVAGKAGDRPCQPLSLSLPAWGLQGTPELEWGWVEGNKGCSGDVFLVLHETLGSKGTGEPHLTFSGGALVLGAQPGTWPGTVSIFPALGTGKQRKEKWKLNPGEFFFSLRERKRRRAQVTFEAIIP